MGVSVEQPRRTWGLRALSFMTLRLFRQLAGWQEGQGLFRERSAVTT